MLLENRTKVRLTIKMKSGDTQNIFFLDGGDSKYFGELSEGDTLEIESSKGHATIMMLSDEKYMWQVKDDSKDDFVKESIRSNGALSFEEIFYGRGRQQNRKSNGICIQVTA